MVSSCAHEFFSVYEKVINLLAQEKAYRSTWLFEGASFRIPGKRGGLNPGLQMKHPGAGHLDRKAVEARASKLRKG
jgi:hypothetical protein